MAPALLPRLNPLETSLTHSVIGLEPGGLADARQRIQAVLLSTCRGLRKARQARGGIDLHEPDLLHFHPRAGRNQSAVRAVPTCKV